MGLNVRSVVGLKKIVFLNACLLLFAAVSFDTKAQDQINPRILLIFDTSSSMAWDVDANESTDTGEVPPITSTLGDGSWDPWYVDTNGNEQIDEDERRACCPGKGNSRLYYAKEAVRNMVFAAGDIDFALMKFAQGYATTGGEAANSYWSNQESGTADILRYYQLSRCPTFEPYPSERDYEWLAVEFPHEEMPDNRGPLMMWMDHHEFKSDGSGEPDDAQIDWSRYGDEREQELRADGWTPIAGSLEAAAGYLRYVLQEDAQAACRGYSVILLTDGEASCATQSTLLSVTAGLSNLEYATDVYKTVKVWVIGFAVTEEILGRLNSIASTGGTDYARGARSQNELSGVLADIIGESFMIETCNQLDDDCDGDIDEDFRPERTYCNTGCDTGTPEDEDILCERPSECLCDGIDNNCDGVTDEPPNGTDEWLVETPACGGCDPNVQGQEYCENEDEGRCQRGEWMCLPGTGMVCVGAVNPTNETCNGLDDDCDGFTDEVVEGESCGACGDGHWYCVDGRRQCCADGSGADNCVSIGISNAETCNGEDDDCDGEIDEGLTQACGGCDPNVQGQEYCTDRNQGVCAAGQQSCVAGEWSSCSTNFGPSDEICNNQDDDCDGQVDEGLVGEVCGICQDGHWYCIGGTEQCCSGVNEDGSCIPALTPGEEQCNGIDDDCDGSTDEDVKPRQCMDDPYGETDGIGVCHHGYQSCVGGEWGYGEPWVIGACGNQHLPSDELCNGLDDNCNGETDEGIAPSETCGECGDGLKYCVDGFLRCCSGIGDSGECLPVGVSAPEICNGVDDDCNGIVDDKLVPRTCMAEEHADKDGIGVCHHGYQDCQEGVWGAIHPDTEQWEAGYCKGEVLPKEEECNLADDNCNGEIDEGAGGGDCGPCGDGVYVCVGGALQCEGASEPKPETCNNVDDDCDGYVDDNLWQECLDDEIVDRDGVGICHHGVQTCRAGAYGYGETEETWVAGECGQQQLPEEELCDCLDNDCDGETDEDIGSPVGETCNGCGEWQCVNCDMQCVGVSEEELCNGMDDNCNGLTDEDVYAECGGCDPEAYPDLDCAAAQSTGAVGAGAGECQVGLRWCEFDALNPELGAAFGECRGSVGPIDEICDSKDNDCDGVTDEAEDIAQIGGGCATAVGVCETGAWQCLDDGTGVNSLQCCKSVSEEVGCIPPAGPSDEICNSRDDDCDGEVDEGVLGTGEACGSDLGACEPGVTTCVCSNGEESVCEIVCVGAVVSVEETCNALDDDCNGLIDDGLPSGETCSHASGNVAVGICDQGVLECRNGKWECSGTRPSNEVCDGKDNDCDGTIDVNLDIPCPANSVCIDGACAEPCVGQENLCASGQTCEERPNSQGEMVRVCIADVCIEGSDIALQCVTNPNWCSGGEEPPCRCDRAQGRCVGLCEGTVCNAGTECVPKTGTCEPVEGSCYAAGCSAGERCEQGVCVPDPCSAKTCASTEYCNTEGECVLACNRTDCRGVCFESNCLDLCGTVDCASGETCDPFTGECILPNACDDAQCNYFEVCVGGECVDDPCWNIHCPNGYRCERGNCFIFSESDLDTSSENGEGIGSDNDTAGPTSTDENGTDSADVPKEKQYIFATGTGGCMCRQTPGIGSRPGIMATVLVAFLMFAIRLGRRRVRVKGLAWFTLLGIALFVMGCDVKPYTYGLDDTDDGIDRGSENVMQSDVDTSADTDIGKPECDGGSVDDNCDSVDDDCDGMTDEDVDLMTNAEHCGSCGNDCTGRYPNAYGECHLGKCEMGGCSLFYQNLNNDLEDGCEYYCKRTSDADSCNGVDFGDGLYEGLDDDCDGLTDEDKDLASDPMNCGRCGNICRVPHATPTCIEGKCTYESCYTDFYDYDNNDENGCEYACIATSETELCNNIDDNCDGQTDEGNPGGGDVCYTVDTGCVKDSTGQYSCTGTCSTGLTQCQAGNYVCEGQVIPVPREACDGLDDNCDGVVDDNLVQPCATEEYEEIGACQMGIQACENGQFGLCVGEVIPTDEVCDGIDNDCDGEVDEDAIDMGALCGGAGPPNAADEGACSTGIDSCVDGNIVCLGAQAPVLEVCDAVDNDCDGLTDENVTSICGGCDPEIHDYCEDRAQGLCEPGVTTCEQGVYSACIASIEPSPELCDNLDNDCDGLTDEGPDGGIWTGDECNACGGIEYCIDHQSKCCSGLDDEGNCIIPRAPTSEECNGVDDDCDGEIDDGLQRECMEQEHLHKDGVGVCHKGIETCQDGEWGYGDTDGTWTAGECGNQQLPLDEEHCNNLDDDCDGETDEDVPPRSCGEYSLGICQTGTQTCVAGVWGWGETPVSWTADVCGGQQLPMTETCNNLDDDCDGIEDNNLQGVGAACDGDDSDNCEEGLLLCTNGTIVCSDDTGDSTEICDGLDNDCNGVVDDEVGDPPGDLCDETCSAYRGIECGGSYGWQCQYNCASEINHAEDEVECDGLGQVVTTESWCNGLDDNCDGVVDDNLLLGPDNCNACGNNCFDVVGDNVASVACVSAECRINACEDGYWDLDGDRENGCEYGPCDYTGVEGTVCDEIDNDCDGVVDNGVSQPEVCDGVDNDCDGDVDEIEELNPPDLCNNNCPDGSYETVCAGTDGWQCEYQCYGQGGVVECIAGEVAEDESICDGADNDCDGLTDEGFVLWDESAVTGAHCDNGKLGMCHGEGWIKCAATMDAVVCCESEAETVCPSDAVVERDPTPGEEVNPPDGVDDDCDGYTDDGLYECVETINIVGLSEEENFEIFKYEASRFDATGNNEGDTVPCSQPNVAPWVDVSYLEARAACVLMNEHDVVSTPDCECDLESPDDNPSCCWDLCSAGQWFYACSYHDDQGGAPYQYPYGDTYDAEVCNGLGYDTDPSIEMTGTAGKQTPQQNCVSPFGDFEVWDLSGNVEEWTLDRREVDGQSLRVIRGGSYQSLANGLSCDFDFFAAEEAGVKMDQLGFRCCRGGEPISRCELTIDHLVGHPFGFEHPDDINRCQLLGWWTDGESAGEESFEHTDWVAGKSEAVGSADGNTAEDDCLFATVLEGAYSTNQVNHLYSPQMDLSECSGYSVILSWSMWLELDEDAGDTFSVEVYNPTSEDWNVLNTYTTSVSTWTSYTATVPSTYLIDRTVLRFTLTANDGSGTARGAYIDNIELSLN